MMALATMRPLSFEPVGDLLADTITRSAKTQTDADGELAWLRKRLDNERRNPRSRGKLALVGDDSRARGLPTMAATGSGTAPADKENAALSTSGAPSTGKGSSTMSVLQLRRFLRAVGQPTVGLKPELNARLEKVIFSGALKTYVDGMKERPREAVECVGQRRKTDAILAQAESMLAGDEPVSQTTAAPKRPLRESMSSNNNDRSSRSSTCSDRSKAGPQLSGQEQDAVVAKIRSVAKRSASPEKKLPFTDDDTPNTKGARLKKEMEDRLARQTQLQKAKQEPAPAASPAPKARTAPKALSETPSTPPSARPPVPSSPAPMPPASPPRAVAPPPPMADAPQQPASAPPAPESSAPRAADLATDPTDKGSKCVADKDAQVPEAPTVSAPVPAKTKDPTVEAVVEGVAALSVSGGKGGAGGGGVSAPVEKQASTSKAFGSPGRHRTPAKTPTRKANPFAKDSISTPGPSGLKVAAHKALNRVASKPSTPEVSPTGSSTTQDAFAKFRAMDSNTKKGSSAFKLRTSPSPKSVTPVKPNASQQMPPPQKLDFGSGGTASKNTGAASTSSTSSKREAHEAQALASAARVQAEATAASNRARAAAAAEKERAEARAKAKSVADKAAADEARRDAQAKAEARAREAALKAAAERKLKEEAAEAALRREAELKRRREEQERRREAEKRSAAAESLRKAEEKKKAELRAAAEAAARKEAEEEAAAAMKRAALQKAVAAKPPTPPRPTGKAPPPPTPPRPASQASAPPTPPRPGHGKSQAQPQPASPWTPSKPVGASGAAGAEAHQLAYEKKKREIAKRMEDLKLKNMPKPTTSSAKAVKTPVAAKPAPAPAPAAPAPVPAPVPAPAPAPVAQAGKSVPKEERESYDDYEVEPPSGSESGDDGEEAAQEIVEPQEASDKSAIPDWARGKTLAKILDKQYGGPNPLNPDKIFPEFFTCNLEHIFNTKKTKWDRSSSGNWHTDRLTIAEKLAYQRAMGFDK